MRFLSDILAKAGLVVDGVVTLNSVANATVDTDKFIVIDSGVVKYRTGAQLLSDIGAQAAGSYVPTSRTLTINGTTYDLSADRTWSIPGSLPTGGNAGDILAKTSEVDYAVTWIPNYTSKVQHYVKLGAAMTIGTPVYVSGGTGQSGTNMIVSKSSNTTEATSSKTMGLIATGGAQNDIVFVVTEGLLSGIDTSGATIGDPVWLGSNGALLFGLVNKPVAPLHTVYLGVVTRVQQNNGEIFVKVQNGFELDELHDVLFASLSDKDIIYRDAATGLWKNTSLSVLAPIFFKTDYDDNIVGNRNSSNKVFTLSANYVTGTTRVFVNGIRYTLGASYDYVETGSNQITFTNAPDLGDLIVVDYIKS
jgi:hypothetical protein